MRFSQITYPKCTSRSICVYRSIVTRRRGKRRSEPCRYSRPCCLNEGPLPKAGKWARVAGEADAMRKTPHLKSPARRQGNQEEGFARVHALHASMKVPARKQENKSIPKQPFKHSNTIDKPKHHASDTPRLRHVPGSRGDRQSLQRPLSAPPNQSAIELVIPPLPCRASLADEQHAARE